MNDKILIAQIVQNLGAALYFARTGRMFQAGVCWSRASAASWKIYDSHAHVRAQVLVFGVEQALMTIEASR